MTTRHTISVHLREDLHRGETLVLETYHSDAGLSVQAIDVLSDRRRGSIHPDVFIAVEEIGSIDLTAPSPPA